MGDDHDREALAQLVDQFLDLGRRDRVERGGGLVKQQDFGPHRNGARDTQSLLLTARQRQGAVVELVLDLVPQRGLPQRVLDPVVDLRFRQALII